MSRRALRAPRRALGALTCALLLLAGAARAAPTRIMPLGDSITGSPGCWRALLWSRLQTAGTTSIDMVGTRAGDGCGVPYDGDNEGWPGYLAMNIASQNQLPPWLASDRPDVVMMHLGTNDVWNGRTAAQILAAYTTLVGQMRAQNPGVKILVSQIIPMDSARSCSTCAQGVVSLNAAIPAWAAGLSTAASPITVVDQWTGFSTATDTYDGVHPNDSGNQKMADRLYPALVAALGGGETPSFSLSATPASLSLALSGAAASATSTVTVTPSGGFAGSVALSASGGPSGATIGFSPASTTGTSVMTVSVPANVPAGSYPLTVTGTSGALTRTTAVALTVTQAVAQDFALSLTPSTLSIGKLSNANVTVNIARVQGFGGAVQLSASGLPASVTGSFTPNPATGASSTLVLTIPTTAPSGPAAVTITGTSGSLKHTATLNLDIGVYPSIAVSASPSTLTLAQGGSVTTTVTLTRTNATGPITLLANGGVPAGVTATFNPAAPTGNTSTLTLTASGTAATGPATVTLTATDGSVSLRATTTLALTVTPGSSTGTAPCAGAVTFAGNTGNFNTAGAVCYRTAATVRGWGCYNMDGRTLKVNNVAVTCGAALPAAWSDGYTYFAATAGTYPWAGIYTW